MNAARLGSKSSLDALIVIFKTDLLAPTGESICGLLQGCALQQPLRECQSAQIRLAPQLAFASSHFRGIRRWTPAIRLSCR